MKAVALLLACLLAVSSSRQVDHDAIQPKGIGLSIQVCTAPGACRTENTGLVVDWYLACPGGNPRTCTNKPTDYTPYGISLENGNRITLNYSPTGGSRSYLTTANGADSYRTFNLLNRELSFEVDVDAMGCGMNSALYFIEMDAGGNKPAGYTGAQYGTGYCDAQPAQTDRPACPEMDIWEANSHTTVFTTHPCPNGANCDAWGCGFNTYTRGNKNFYGRGSSFTVDSTRRHTVVTQFITDNGQDDGNLREIRRYYVQDGRRIDLPTFNGYNSLSDNYCSAFGIPSSTGGTASVSKMGPNLTRMVLSFSLWGNPSDGSQMAWMDNEPNGPCPNAYKDPNPKTSFGNIKFGPIGSTA